jgi:Ras-related protein Rab-7A
VLLFDVNDRKTLDALTKWWAEFKDKAPLSDDEVSDFCCVVVGNKIDLVQEDSNPVSEPEALKFIDTLVPPEELQQSPQDSPYTFNITTALPSSSIDINVNDYRRSRRISSQTHPRSRSKSLLPGSTMSSTRTGLVYHTPSSSIFDNYESARASPLPPSRSPSPPQSIIVSPSGSTEVRRKKSSSSTNSSTPTITPSLFARTHHLCSPVNSLPSISQQQDIIAPPTLPILERRPKLFFTSAKTGLGVPDVFEYVAQRVTMRLEYQEDIETRTLHMREQSTDVIHLGLQPGVDAREGGSKSKLGRPGSCC